MISPTELRIGNYINVKCVAPELNGTDNFDAQPCTVINLLSLVNGNLDFEFEPILLTPEILEKCGLGINKYAASIRIGSNKNDSYLYYTLEDDVFGFCIENSDFDANSDLTEELPIELPNIKYLHQLQNLYHALTGTELEINL